MKKTFVQFGIFSLLSLTFLTSIGLSSKPAEARVPWWCAQPPKRNIHCPPFPPKSSVRRYYCILEGKTSYKITFSNKESEACDGITKLVSSNQFTKVGEYQQGVFNPYTKYNLSVTCTNINLTRTFEGTPELVTAINTLESYNLKNCMFTIGEKEKKLDNSF